MNRDECRRLGNPHHLPNRRKLDPYLREWKTLNNIKGRCVVHHRDDTEECRRYNEEHYELWGFNEDGSFEYGKYVVFMAYGEHTKYHNMQRVGESSPLYGRHHSEETRKKISEHSKGKVISAEQREVLRLFHTGKHHTETAKEKMRITRSAKAFIYTIYKNNGGLLKWQSFQKALKQGEITFEVRPVSVLVGGV